MIKVFEFKSEQPEDKELCRELVLISTNVENYHEPSFAHAKSASFLHLILF